METRGEHVGARLAPLNMEGGAMNIVDTGEAPGGHIRRVLVTALDIAIDYMARLQIDIMVRVVIGDLNAAKDSSQQ